MPKPKKTNRPTKHQTAEQTLEDLRMDLIYVSGEWFKRAARLKDEQPANPMIFGFAEGLSEAARQLTTVAIK